MVSGRDEHGDLRVADHVQARASIAGQLAALRSPNAGHDTFGERPSRTGAPLTLRTGAAGHGASDR